jgi:hypothetical protein
MNDGLVVQRWMDWYGYSFVVDSFNLTGRRRCSRILFPSSVSVHDRLNCIEGVLFLEFKGVINKKPLRKPHGDSLTCAREIAPCNSIKNIGSIATPQISWVSCDCDIPPPSPQSRG